jgi:diacylglycerol kinase (ATP)
MNRRHLVFIVNPRSGVKRQKAVEQAVDAFLDKTQYSYEIQHTRFARHGTELAREAAAAGAFAVVAVGGDGSVNDVATGLCGTDTALAIIPKGSGNGMARTLGLPRQTAAAIRVINGGRIAQMDIGFADERLFVSNAGVGFEALISEKFAPSKRRGFFTYGMLVTKHLWRYHSREWRISIDGKELQTRAFMVSVANGQHFGYNFRIAPQADWKDGLLDLVIVRDFPKLLGLPLLFRLMNGSLLKSRYVAHYRGREVTVTHPGLSLLQTDGEAHPCGSAVRFRIEPSALRVIIP